MKLNKTMMAVALGLSVAGLVRAQNTIYLTGSTAMRSTIYSELTNAGTVFVNQPVFTGYSGSGSTGGAGKAGGDTYMAFYGQLVGGSGNTTINCYWSGSEDGILHVANYGSIKQTFMDQSLVQTSSSQDGSGTPATITPEYADLCMADNAQQFSRTTSPSINNGTEVGVITFKWVRNPGLWTGSNVTDSQILQALTGGNQGIGKAGAKRAVFDGNSADTNDYVYVSGRDTSSGTRVNTYGDTGYGILNPANQVEINTSGVMQYFTTVNVHTGQTITNYSGEFGYSSGGTLAGTMGGITTTNSDMIHTNFPAGGPVNGFSVIAYLGTSDATTATNDGAVALTYNGIPFAPTNIEEGTYTFWGNEYCYVANTDTSGTLGYQVYQLISTNTPAFCDGTIAISLPAMHSSRGGPTTFPTHN
jgi:hypothetical protein